LRSYLPPSGLPAISPSRGEITRGETDASFACLEAGRFVRDWRISPLEGEMAGRPEGGVSIPQHSA